MKKEIIHEIYRQHQIMGIYKPLLSENKYVDLATDGIKSLLSKSRTIPNVADEILVGGMQVSKKFVDDILDVLADPSNFNNLTSNQKYLFGQIVSQDEDIVNDIYTNLINDFIKNSGKTEKKLITDFAESLSKGENITSVLNRLNGGIEDDFLNAVINKKIRQEVNKIKLPKPNSKLATDPTTGLPWDSPDYVPQMAKQLNKFQTILKKYGVTKASKWLKDALKKYELFWMQYMRNYYADTLLNWKNVQINNINKAKKFLNNAYEFEKQGNNNEAVRELQKSLSQILLYKRGPDMDVSEIIEKFITENPNLDERTIKNFLDDDAAGNKTIRDFLDGIADGIGKQVRKPINQEAKAFAELIPGVGLITRKSDLAGTVAGTITAPLQRWFNLIAWKDPRSAYEVITAMAKRGVRQEYSATLATYFLAHILLIPGAISVFKSLKEQTGATTRGNYLELLKGLCDDGVLTKDCEEIKNELDSIHYYQSEDYIKNYLKELPLHIGALFGEKYDDTSTLGWGGAWYKTYVDETVNLIYNIIQGSAFPVIGKPKADRIINILENLGKKTSQELKSLGIDPNAENLEKEVSDYYRRTVQKGSDESKKVEEVIKNKANELLDKGKEKATEVVTDIVDSEEGFRAWCLKERKTPREVEPYNPDTHFAYTNDGKKWFYDKGTFNPKPE